MRRVFDDLKGAMDDCLLGELFCLRSVLRDRVPPPRRALRSNAPVVCPSFGFDKYFKQGLFLGHALHEKGLQRQKGVCPLVSS